jgi:hypothetical protein
MQAETEPSPVQGASHPHLRQGVTPADRRHHARPGGCINDVWHDRPSVSAIAVGELLRPPQRDATGLALRNRDSVNTWQ